jgi:hypothetical protein
MFTTELESSARTFASERMRAMTSRARQGHCANVSDPAGSYPILFIIGAMFWVRQTHLHQ